MTRERKARSFAHHLALKVEKCGDAYWLHHRYGSRKTLGFYPSLDRLERAIKQYHDRELAKAEVKASTKKLFLLLIDLGFRELSKKYHPDMPGGSDEMFKHLKTARDALRGRMA
jgi:hypothetical protein